LERLAVWGANESRGNMKRFSFWPFLAFIIMSTAFGYCVDRWLGIGLWAGVLLVAFSLLVNGWIAEIEDEAPGGFNPRHPVKKPNP
jgi:hypothetical protein